MKSDSFTIEVLQDGSIKVTTDKVSAPNHLAADRMLREIFTKAGGEVEIKHKHGKTMHHHSAENMTSLEAGSGKHEH